MMEYLQQIVPESLPSLLKDQLDSDILTPIIQCFKEFVSWYGIYFIYFSFELSALVTYSLLNSSL